MTPDLLSRDLLTLQRMAYEITSGLLHLHENNYIHRYERDALLCSVWFYVQELVTMAK